MKGLFDRGSLRARRIYMRVLENLAADKKIFPLEISLGRPEKPGDFARLRRETAIMEKMSGSCFRIRYKEISSRAFGSQQIPECIIFDNSADYFRFLGKTREAEHFFSDYRQIIRQIPALQNWCAGHTQKIIEQHGNWPDLTAVLLWFHEHPRPGIYIREIPAVNNTKFIEQHTAILKILLDHILPEQQINAEESSFALRFGLKTEEPLLRLRPLDAELKKIIGYSDLAVPAKELVLPAGCRRIIFVENKTVYNIYPSREKTICIWGSGFSVLQIDSSRLAHIHELWYWGDLDAQGFLILGRLRRKLPGLRSFFMNRPVWEEMKNLASPGTPCTDNAPRELDAEEKAMYEFLRDKNLRIEQETIPYKKICSDGK